MTNDSFSIAENFVNHTRQHVFLTGKAGTGKTTFLKKIIQTTHKKTLVTAPTGIAALNAGGVTLHSQFQLPLGGFLPAEREIVVQDSFKFETRSSLARHLRMNDIKRKTIREAELLIIDEVSMLRADILDAVDFVLQYVRRTRQPFGGLQVLFIGDLLQLPPVVKNNEWTLLQEFYTSPFFFDALALKKQPPVYIELETIYRQSDPVFTGILNKLRYNQVSEQDIEVLNKRYVPGFAPQPEEGYITLTTHNRIADDINQRELNKLVELPHTYAAEVTGEYPENIYPCEQKLVLKEGAQVMFIKNDISGEQRYFNGKIAWVHKLDKEQLSVKTEEGTVITVSPYTWEHIRYTVDDASKEIREDVLGTFVQYPLRLAWAITIHKSQGLTFDKAILDVGNVFASGQSYVAFSRLRSLEGLVLSRPFGQQDIDNNASVLQYEKTREQQGNIENLLQQASTEYFRSFVLQLYDFLPLIKTWQQHLDTYNKEETHSEKQQQYDWALQQAELLYKLSDTAVRFNKQLQQLLGEKPLHFQYLEERLQAAQKYFEEPLRKCISELVLQRKKMAQIKRTKAYVNELEELDALMMKYWRDLHKACLLVRALRGQNRMDKTVCETEIDLSWRWQLLLAEAEKPQVPAKKKKKEKGETYKETLLLYKQGKSLEEIATERRLSMTTIEGHLARWVAKGELDIKGLLKPEKLSSVLEAVEAGTPPTLSALKAQLGVDFSFSEIRLALAYRQSQMG